MKKLVPFILELFAGFVLVLGVLVWCEKRRVFFRDEENNHTAKRWHYLYEYARQHKDIDVMVLGNSHAFTGLLPELLSKELDARTFILASPGTYITDGYYMLEEALTLHNPKLVVIETYPIGNFNQRHLPAVDLLGYFQSFDCRRNTKLKLRSTFKLFTLDSAPYAWSTALRNHSYIFDNPDLIRYNLKHPEGPVYDDTEEYLGRFIRFTSGLTEETLNRYVTEGPPVDATKMTVSKDAADALQNILDLCKKKNIQVLFLTLPMFTLHVANSDALYDNLKPYVGDYPWFYSQHASLYRFLGPDCFEDTYNANQHMTYKGARLLSEVLALHIKRNKFLEK